MTTVVSVIVPVYNEASTVGKVLDELLAVVVEGVRFNIVVVVSPSTDGTAKVVAGYRGQVQIQYEDKANGKGAAVRRGIESSGGDIIMIQDADLEYSIGDYPRLLQPILDDKADFVLGSRYGAGGMRSFTSAPLKAWLMNVGHKLFTFAVNRLFGGSMSDPFTMFKVFRRSCISGAEFKCNRFDFDFELVITLLKRGYKPLEIPVSYKSRCFDQGKKVRIWRDPPTWLWTMTRLYLRSKQHGLDDR